jgi:hypothetical protein
VFETFPNPEFTEKLRAIGSSLHRERAEILLKRDLGLTRLYNLVNDPELPDSTDVDIARLREIHAELDHAVTDAYGWSDIALGYGFHAYRSMERWMSSPAAGTEILDRLVEENHYRAERDRRHSRPGTGVGIATEDGTLFA